LPVLGSANCLEAVEDALFAEAHGVGGRFAAKENMGRTEAVKPE
jgi:hypothetical protein